MVDCSSSKRSVSIRFRLATELVVLIGKMFPCRGKLCRIEAGLTRTFIKEKHVHCRLIMRRNAPNLKPINSMTRVIRVVGF